MSTKYLCQKNLALPRVWCRLRSALEKRTALAVAAFAFGLPFSPPGAAAQATTEVVRGLVTSDSGVPLAGASIVVVRSSDQRVRSTQTDSAGRYQVVWENGTGRYVIRITAPGRSPVQIQVHRADGDSVLVADAHLPAVAPIVLAPVSVAGPAPRPERMPANGPETGSAEQISFVENADRRLPPDQSGDLMAVTALANPAALPTTGGVSVFGLPATQNSTVLNGMAFSGATVPRTTGAAIRSSSTSYDPSVGWFSGSRTNVQLVTGGLFTTWTTNLTLDLPQVQATDPVAARLGQRYTNLDVSAGGDGRLFDDRLAYNVALQGSRRTADLASLLTADPDLLEHAGVAPDSAARFQQLARAAGVPMTTAQVPDGLSTDNAVFLGRLDHTPYDWNSLTPARSTWGLTAYGFWNRAEAQGMGPTAVPAHAGLATRAAAALQAAGSFYLGGSSLADVRTGVTYASRRDTPYLRLPDGHVRVVSDLSGGTGGVSQLLFGGNAGLQGNQHNWTWESTAELQLYPTTGARHRVKLSADVRYDRAVQMAGANLFGTFSYNSLADLEANAPSSFTRTLHTPLRRSGAWNGYLAVGDWWRASESLQLLAGLRMEGNVFTDRPAYNPQVDSLFGARTDFAPNTLNLSPRLGFTWNVRGARGRPRGVLRGGGGEFRNLIDPNLLATPSVTTGLSGGPTHLTCIGAAVPVPDWSTWAADPSTIPASCLAGGSSEADSARPVQLVDRRFTAERSWRANLSWSSNWRGNVYSILGTWSEDRNQHGTRDLNFAGAPRFLTPEGRPVFAEPASIVPGSGVVSTVDAREAVGYGRVVAGVADLRSLSRQLTLTLRPALRLGQHLGDPLIAYTYSRSRTLARGFDAPTFGSPDVPEWARADLDARHQIQIQTVIRPFRTTAVVLFLVGRIRSGLPYTPLVASDVNGDGLANDRAYVFDPATVVDTALGRGLSTLLAAGAPGARRCLAAQLGHAAGRNSCQGPWATDLNIAVHISGRQVLHLPRLDVTVNLANPLGGIDQLLHGANNLHGWGTGVAPDPILYTVRGFDPTTGQFLYQVNPRFGATRAASTTQRAPFRLTLMASLDLGRPLPAQELRRWLAPGRRGHPGSRMAATQLRQRLERQVPDPFLEILGQSDSLLLSAVQTAALRQLDARYQTEIDSAWTTLAASLAALPDTFDDGAAYHLMDNGIDDAWELTRGTVRRELPAILSPEQLSTLGGWAGQLWRAPGRLHVRLFVAG